MKTKTLLFFNCYWIFSVIYFCFGRYQWIIPSYLTLLFFIAINYAAVNLGYYSTHPHKLQMLDNKCTLFDEKKTFESIRKWFAIACIITIVFQISWVITFLGKFSVITALSNIGENYYARMEMEFDKPVLILQIRTLLWIVTYFVYPIGFMFFKSMGKFYKILFIATVFVEVFASLNMGVSKNIGDLIFIYLATLFLRTARRSSSSQTKEELSDSPKGKSLIVKIVAVVSVFLIAFSVIQSSRSDASDRVFVNIFYKFSEIRSFSIFDIFFFWNDGLLKVFDKIGEYVSHAYCGLAYALELPFENTFGLGFSGSLMDYANQYFGIPDVNKFTYNYRIDYLFGWKDGQWWPTAFTWFGNAISLWLVPVLMFLFGKFFKNVESKWFSENQILSLVMYCQLFITFVYLSCNAQIFQGRHIIIATVILFVLYFVRNVLKIKFKWSNDGEKKIKRS